MENTVFRKDGERKACGKVKYAGDFYTPDMLYAVIVRSEYAHAQIKSIKIPVLDDDSFCFTAKDLKENILPSIFSEQPAFADSHIRYEGEALAVVAAPTLEKARALAKKISIDIEKLEVVDDYIKALDKDAPKLYDKGNLCCDFHSNKGDVQKAFEQCDFVLEDTFELPVQCHGFLEPEACFAYMEEGTLKVISSTQNVFDDKAAICKVLGLKEDEVQVCATAVGGGFGGKDPNPANVYPAIVSYYTNRPVRLVFDREENIRYGVKRHACTAKAKIGFMNDGKIKAFEGKMYFDTGAYSMLGPAVLGLGMEHFAGPYYIENVKLDGYLAYTNHAPASAMRGFGAPQGSFCTETLINLACEKLNIDPIDFRIKNAVHRGQTEPMGAVNEHSIAFEEALVKFKQSDFYKEMKEKPQKGCGYGIAAGMMSCGLGKNIPDKCYVKIEKKNNGGYVVYVGLVDIGQGSETTLALIAAKALGVEYDKITMVMADTKLTVNSGTTAASRSTYIAGNAIIDAAEKIKEGQICADGFAVMPEVNGSGVHTLFSFMVQGVKLKIDRTTGIIKLLWVHNVSEAGNVIDKTMIDGQIFGGILMSCGYALSEQIRYVNGHSMEDSLNSYVMLTSNDAPHLTNENVESSEESGPFGAKGMAEAPTVPLAGALTSAVRSLCPNLVIKKLPIDNNLILKELKNGI